MIISDISLMTHQPVLDLCLLAELFHPDHYPDQVSSRYSIAHAKVLPGQATLPHTLLHSSEVYYILEGSGEMHINQETAEVRSGQVIYIPPGAIQHIRNSGPDDLIFLAIVDPMWQEDDEILGSISSSEPECKDVFLSEAIREAEIGRSEGGIPIGSVLVKDGRIIGRGHNRRVQEEDPIIHAEIDCLRNAGRIGSYQGCTLYSTLMPCYLCAGAVVQFGISTVIAGESETFPGAREFLLSHGVRVIDMHNQECIRMMTDFIRDYPDLWNEDIGEL